MLFRSVLWQFADLHLNSEEISALEDMQDPEEFLEGLLTQSEIGALKGRIANLLQEGKFPLPPTDWPAIPWPPY